MMDFHSEEEVREILELREWISDEVDKRQKEIEKLRQNLLILDSFVKKSSFSKASHLAPTHPVKTSEKEPVQDTASVIPLKTADDHIIANAHITSDELVIIPSADVILDPEVHPFKSFFLGRIIGNMEEQDRSYVQTGKIPQNLVISCMVNKDGNKIREILIKNYRQKERINEIINTATWSFSRMIENSRK